MPCHNRSYDLERVLSAYDGQQGQPTFELIAVDDASSDATYELLCNYRPCKYTLHVERFEKNRGPAAARNRGIELAQAPLIAFVGDDIVPGERFVQGHIAAHHRRPEPGVAILGRTAWPEDMPQNTLMRHIDGVGAQQFSYHYLRDGDEYDFRHLYTSNISLKRELLHRLDHWFDTEFPYAAFEDVELAFRLKRKGLRIIYQAGIAAYHYHYHTIWTFTQRQYLSGLMAWVLMRKHPAAAPHILQRPQLKLLLRLWTRRTVARGARMGPDATSWWEDLALRIASFYEWRLHPALDEFYLGLLEYWYSRGVVEGSFRDSNRQAEARAIHLQSALLPLLRRFVTKTQRRNLSLPKDIQPAVTEWLELQI
jgi:GT2 family glycosyltransferase